jgi:hypothetical protein
MYHPQKLDQDASQMTIMAYQPHAFSTMNNETHCATCDNDQEALHETAHC